METIFSEERDGVRWIMIEGEWDHEACVGLSERLEQAWEGGSGEVVFALDGLRFLCSMGIGALIGARKTLDAAGRRMRMTGLRPSLRSLLDSMNLLDLLGAD